MKHPETAALAAAARERTGLTQEAFAKLLRAGLRTIANWESGLKPPTPLAQLVLEEIRDGWLPGGGRKERDDG